MEDTEKAKVIMTQALGRPFRLGMLYDRVHDTIIPGETLFTMKEMENCTFKKEKEGFVPLYYLRILVLIVSSLNVHKYLLLQLRFICKY